MFNHWLYCSIFETINLIKGVFLILKTYFTANLSSTVFNILKQIIDTEVEKAINYLRQLVLQNVLINCLKSLFARNPFHSNIR